MSVRVTFHCGGCDAVAPGTKPLYREFRGSCGTWGVGHYHVPSPEDVCPEGWIAYDLIGATYCPKCWAEIEATIETSRAARAGAPS